MAKKITFCFWKKECNRMVLLKTRSISLEVALIKPPFAMNFDFLTKQIIGKK